MNLPLAAYFEAIVHAHNAGASALNKGYNASYKQLAPSDVAAVAEDVSKDISQYNIDHKIRPASLELGKLTAFTAKHLKIRNNSYEAAPLFFGYLSILDLGVLGKGINLRDIGPWPVICENLNSFLKDQWLAPFTYLKGIEVTLSLWVTMLTKDDEIPSRN